MILYVAPRRADPLNLGMNLLYPWHSKKDYLCWSRYNFKNIDKKLNAIFYLSQSRHV